MRGLLAVARREMLEKRFIFVAAVVASLVPFAVPLVRGLHGPTGQEVREWLAVILAAIFAAGLAVALGATVIASDLAERRLGFYFSRPISGFAVWAGKLGAAALISLGTAAIIYAPALAADRGRLIHIDPPFTDPRIVALVVLVALLLCHAIALAVRARSILLAVDAAALALLGLATAWLLQRLALAFAMEALAIATVALIVLVAISLVLAGLFAVTRGRSDSQAAHKTLSAVLWGVLALGVMGLMGYVAWVVSATPRDLKNVWLALPANKGNWTIVQGPSRGGEPAFLFNTSTGQYRTAGAGWRLPVLSPDGANAAWFEPVEASGPFEVVTWKLNDPAAKPVRTRVFLRSTPMAFLSERGERLATISEGLLSIYDLTSGSSIGSARIGNDHGYSRGFFLDRDRFRIFRPSSDAEGYGAALSWVPRGSLAAPAKTHVDILEFDVSSKTLVTTGAIEKTDSTVLLRASPSGDRILVPGMGRLELRDGRSGAFLSTLAMRGPTTTRVFGRFLSDGRIVASVVEGSSVRIEIFSGDGRPEHTIPVPARDRISLGGETEIGKLIVAAGGDPNEPASRRIFLVDLLSGEVRQVADRLFPITYFASWISFRPNYQAAPGSEATKLFFGPGGSLVRFDPLTGQRRVILGKR